MNSVVSELTCRLVEKYGFQLKSVESVETTIYAAKDISSKVRYLFSFSMFEDGRVHVNRGFALAIASEVIQRFYENLYSELGKEYERGYDYVDIYAELGRFEGCTGKAIGKGEIGPPVPAKEGYILEIVENEVIGVLDLADKSSDLWYRLFSEAASVRQYRESMEFFELYEVGFPWGLALIWWVLEGGEVASFEKEYFWQDSPTMKRNYNRFRVWFSELVNEVGVDGLKAQFNRLPAF